MGGDALGHLGIARFGSRAIGATARGGLDKPLGIPALARPGTTQHQTYRWKARSVRAR
jgi:hypothetical protein